MRRVAILVLTCECERDDDVAKANSEFDEILQLVSKRGLWKIETSPLLDSR